MNYSQVPVVRSSFNPDDPDGTYARAVATGFLPQPTAPFGSQATPIPGAAPSQTFAPVMAAMSASNQQAAGGPPSPLQSMPERWPSYQNPKDAIIAQAQGVYDPNYASPRAKLLNQATNVVRDQNQAFQTDQWKQSLANAAAAHSEYAPVLSPDGTLLNPQQVLSSQIAGDSSGTISKILRSLQGGGTGETPLQPYYPQGGYGRLDTQANALDPLDRTTYNDPVFQQTLARDPEKAKLAYQRLHNRSLDEDVKASNDFRKKQIDTGYQFASNAIQRGAVFDPINRTWKVWNQTEPSADELASALPGQTPKASKQLIPATEDQNRWLNLQHKNVTGLNLPAAPPPASSAVTRNLNYLQKVPDVKAAIDAAKIKLGRDLTPQDQLLIANHAMQDRASNINAVPLSPMERLGNAWAMTSQALTGYTATPEGQASYRAGEGANRNFWGQAVDEMAQGPLEGILYPRIQLPLRTPQQARMDQLNKLTPAQQASIMALK